MTDNDDAPVRVRADVTGFAADVDAMRASLESTLGDGAARAGQAVESALLRAVRTGQLGFADLQRVASAAMAEIARSAISSGLSSLFGGGGTSGGVKNSGLLGLASGLLGAALGLPGRATGGPVQGGRGYLVGERGPEMFVPTSAGRVEPLGAVPQRALSITINMAAPAGADRRQASLSARRIAAALSRAIEDGEA